MGLLLDSSSYDLGTPQGQQKALRDIIDFHNTQFEQSQGMQNYQVSAYTELTIDKSVGPYPAGVYTTEYIHGLGFAPVVIGFFLQNTSSGFYAPLPYIDVPFGAPATINNYQSYTVDETKLYFKLLMPTSFTTAKATAAFYIFNIPAKVG